MIGEKKKKHLTNCYLFRSYSSEIIKRNVFLICINSTLKSCTSNFRLVHIFTAECTAGTSGNKNFYYENSGIVLAQVCTCNIL